MTQAREGAARPSTLAVTKMLAEAETRRRRAVKYSLLTLLLPLLVGVGLLAYTFYKVRQNLLLNEQLVANNAKLAENANRIQADINRLVTDRDNLLRVANKATNEEELKALKSRILNTADNPAAAAAAPRVYIQISSDGQRGDAARAGAAIQKLGYVVPDVEKVTGAPTRAQVRYFHPEDRDAANKVADAVKEAGLRDAAPTQAGGKVPRGQLEVWFPSDPAQDTQPVRPDLKDKLNEKVEAVNSRREADEAGRNANRPPRRGRP